MSATHQAVILLSLLSCVTTARGVALALRLRENPRAIAAGIRFSGSIMMLLSVLELVPEAIEAMGGGATLAAQERAPPWCGPPTSSSRTRTS